MSEEKETMKLIVGLGNPGIKYRFSRHNAGFLAVDRIAAGYRIPLRTKRQQAFLGRGRILGQEVVLVKPVTYVNRSGEAVRQILEWTKTANKDFLVICDDVYLETGVIRLRQRGGSGGHNGLTSIIETIGTQNFPRLRIGVGRAPSIGEMADYVLRPFPRKERAALAEALRRAEGAALVWLKEGIETAMNRYNAPLPSRGEDTGSRSPGGG